MISVELEPEEDGSKPEVVAMYFDEEGRRELIKYLSSPFEHGDYWLLMTKEWKGPEGELEDETIIRVNSTVQSFRMTFLDMDKPIGPRYNTDRDKK